MNICQNVKCQKEHNGNFGSGKYCSRKCANSRNWTEDDKKKKSESITKYYNTNPKNIQKIIKLKESWKKRKDEQIKIIINCLYCGTEIKNAEKKQKYHELCFRKNLAGRFNRKRHMGNGGWYRGYWCDSSWELAWVIYNLDHEIKFERTVRGFEYEFEGKKHKYYPDFKLEDGSYVEIKGYKTEKDNAKWKKFPFKIKILFEENLKEIFQYVEEKYGKDYIKLYQGNPYNEKKNKCLICNKECKKFFCSPKCSMTFLSRKKRTIEWKQKLSIASKKYWENSRIEKR